MRKGIVSIIVFLLFALWASAENTPEQRAAKAYADKNYQEAAMIYDSLINKGQSADLYYNYANTQFRLNNIGKAILFYERALVLSPYDSDIRRSLEYANTTITDKIDGFHTFFIVEWLQEISKIFNSNQWAYICIGLFVLGLILVLMFLFSTTMNIRKIAFYLGIVVILASFISLFFSFYQKKYLTHNPYAIVMDGSVSVKASPSMAGKELFILHEGTKVEIIADIDNWKKIEIADKRTGWLPAKTIERL